MLQMSKVVQSRQAWRSKAVKRALENKELRKNLAQKREEIAALKKEIKQAKQGNPDGKKNASVSPSR